MKEWGPFDLVFGGSPCNDLVNLAAGKSVSGESHIPIFQGQNQLFHDSSRNI